MCRGGPDSSVRCYSVELRPDMATRRLRVLVVDDNRDIVLTTIALLRVQGHEGMECYNGLEVIKCVKTFDPDVVVMDIGLPGRW